MSERSEITARDERPPGSRAGMGCGGSLTALSEERGKQIEVVTVNLVPYLERLQPSRLVLKLDIEGAEVVGVADDVPGVVHPELAERGVKFAGLLDAGAAIAGP